MVVCGDKVHIRWVRCLKQRSIVAMSNVERMFENDAFQIDQTFD